MGSHGGDEETQILRLVTVRVEMPIENVYIARVNDGLVLVASMDRSSGDSKMELYKNQAKQILKRLNSGNNASRMSVDSNPFVFHYIIENNICYLVLTDKSYPKRLAFLFLEEIHESFIEELRDEHGEEWQNTVETIGRQYAYIKFDRTIQKKKRDYQDPSSSANVRKLTDDLSAIQNVMRKTIDDVLDRGNRLDDVSEMSKNLATESKRFKWNSKKLSLMALYKQYAPFIIVGIVIIVILIINWLIK